jgi:hypothetical protein
MYHSHSPRIPLTPGAGDSGTPGQCRGSVWAVPRQRLGSAGAPDYIALYMFPDRLTVVNFVKLEIDWSVPNWATGLLV